MFTVISPSSTQASSLTFPYRASIPKTSTVYASTVPAPSILTPEELVEIRAAQRTFEGAYIRTSLSQFSFALVVLKIFTSEFYSIGALFAVYGAGVLLVSAYRRHQGNRQFFTETESVGGGDGGPVGVVGRKKFRTSGMRFWR